jgi:hypothetical protein
LYKMEASARAYLVSLTNIQRLVQEKKIWSMNLEASHMDNVTVCRLLHRT